MPFDPQIEAACRERTTQSPQINRPDGSEPPQTHEYTVRQVATELGVSMNVVYYWINHHHIAARRGHDGTWLVNFDTTSQAEYRRRIATSAQIKPKTTNTSKTSRPNTKEAV